jgi:hypothetical protein
VWLQGSALAISQGLARTQQELRPAAAPVPAAAAGLMVDCYAAAAANAKEAGARSGLYAQAVFSSTGRGYVSRLCVLVAACVAFCRHYGSASVANTRCVTGYASLWECLWAGTSMQYNVAAHVHMGLCWRQMRERVVTCGSSHHLRWYEPPQNERNVNA